jgi:hypothetical protein
LPPLKGVFALYTFGVTIFFLYTVISLATPIDRLR